jgi:hypothetical protein
MIASRFPFKVTPGRSWRPVERPARTSLRGSHTALYAITDDEWSAIRLGYEAWLAPENFDGDAQQKQSLGELIRGRAALNPLVAQSSPST